MLNQVDTQKILEIVARLGTNAPVSIKSETRGEVRKLLNALGFETRQYINIGIPVLEEIYNGLLAGNGYPLNHIEGIQDGDSLAACERFSAVVAGNPLPVVNMAVKHVAPVNVDKADKAAQVAALLADLMGNAAPAPLDESRVIELINKHAATPMPRVIEIHERGDVKVVNVGLHHYVMPEILIDLKAGLNVMLVGPAGSGKTTIAHQCADALGVPFYFNGAISSEYKLTGFMDAQGRIVSTAFRKAYENGGLYLFDEIDASMADALLAFNAALANGHMDFPDGTIARHKDFYCMAAANTFGKGADRVYVGRNQLDAASLDRFSVTHMDYDEKLEYAIAGNDNWTRKVIAVRKAVESHKIRHVVSPRASINGAKLLAIGKEESKVWDSVVWKGLDSDSKAKIKATAGV